MKTPSILERVRYISGGRSQVDVYRLATYLEEEQEKHKALEERVRELEPKEPTEKRCNCDFFKSKRFATAVWQCDLHGFNELPTPTDDWELNLKRFGPIPDELKNFIKEEKARSKEEGRREALETRGLGG